MHELGRDGVIRVSIDEVMHYLVVYGVIAKQPVIWDNSSAESPGTTGVKRWWKPER